MKNDNRDKQFTFNGVEALIDTAVLPTLQMSLNSGRHWTQGGGTLNYLASKFGVETSDSVSMVKLQEKFAAFSGHKLT